MTKRDFFILIIKVFGLFSVVTTLFSAIPSSISFATMDLDTFSIFWIAAATIIIIGLFIVLIFKSDQVVRLLKLDKGFDNNEFDLRNLNSTDIVKLGTFIIGGFLILDYVPSFLSHSFFAFKGDNLGMELTNQEQVNLAVSGLNIIIGYLLITNYDFVADRLKTDKKEKE